MGYQLVLVNAWVFDQPQIPGSPPGIWGGGNVPMPNPPINLPPGWESGNPPGIWGGGGVPMPNPPIANVPGAPGYNPGGDHIWGPTDPRPTPPIQLPPGYPGSPPGIWGGGNVPMPTPPIQLPPWEISGGRPPGIWGGGNVPMPSPPINLPPWEISGGKPPHIWGGGNEPFPTPPISGIPGLPGYEQPPSFPILDPGDVPPTPEVPDLNAGSWVYVSEEDGKLVKAFLPWPLAVTHPDYNPNYPPEDQQPGKWVVIYVFQQGFNGLTNAWIPQSELSEATAPPA